MRAIQADNDINKKKVAKLMFDDLVGIPGLEPGKAGPESAVLPLHHIPLFNREVNGLFLNCDAKVITFFGTCKFFLTFF